MKSTLLAFLNKFLRTFRYGTRLRPLRDWLSILAIAAVLLLGTAGWSYFVFEQVSGGETLDGSHAAAPVASTAPLDAVKDIFAKRAAEKAHYLSDYHFVDPSH